MNAKVELYNADCLDILPTLAAGSVDLVIISPPYNCRKDYGAFDDQMPWPDYYIWMGKILNELYRILIIGGTLAINIPAVVRWQAEHRYSHTWSDFDPNYPTHRNGRREVGRGRIEPVGLTLFEMMHQRDKHLREPLVWVKGSVDGEAISTNHQMGSDNNPYMRPCYELILLGSKGQWFHRGGTGMRGREAVPFLDETKDVWFIPGESHPAHPAIFPIEIPRRLIKLFTHAKDAVVLDCFMGTGTTGMAATELSRGFIGIESNLRFFEIAQRVTQKTLFQE